MVWGGTDRKKEIIPATRFSIVEKNTSSSNKSGTDENEEKIFDENGQNAAKQKFAFDGDSDFHCPRVF